MSTEFKSIKKILFVEDDPRDVELTLAALGKFHLANKVVVVNDGAEALDCLYRRGKFEMPREGRTRGSRRRSRFRQIGAW